MSTANQTTVATCLAVLRAMGYPMDGRTVYEVDDSDSHGHTHGSDSHDWHGSEDDHDGHDHDHGEGDHGHSHGFCSGVEGNYSVGLHVAAIFIVLAASAVGALIPLLGKRVPALRLPPFVYIVGKCIATGVMLSVAMIHMINHAAAAFEADCIPASFAEKYEGWAFLFAMIAAVLMHLVDQVAADVATGWMERRSAAEGAGAAGAPAGCRHDKCTTEMCLEDPLADAGHALREGQVGEVQQAGTVESGASSPNSVRSEARNCPDSEHHAHAHDHDHDHAHAHGADTAALECAGHQHGAVVPTDIPRTQRVVAALCMEFGVTLHSVFVGLTLGVTANDELRVLLVALVFHQLFEGLAMGARLADAEMRLTVELALMLIFSFSAPVGVAAGTGAVSASRNALSSASYAMVSGILDSICGGILLYLSFNMLFVDFPCDMRRHCPRHMKGRLWRVLLMFGGVWVGAGVMALIGKWL